MNTGSTARRRLTILGSTGSIGQNTLDVIAQLGGRDAFDIAAITGHDNIELLAAQARACGAAFALHFSHTHGLAENVFASSCRPFVCYFRQVGGRLDGIDRRWPAPAVAPISRLPTRNASSPPAICSCAP